MATRNFQCGYSTGNYLTRAAFVNSPIRNSHIFSAKATKSTSTTLTSLTAYNAANKAAAIAAGSYFYLDVFSPSIYEAALTSVRFAFSKSATNAFNWAIDLNNTEDYMYDDYFTQLATGTVSSGTTSGTITQAVSGDLFTEWRNRIRVVVWGADTSARVISMTSSSYVAGTFDDSQLISAFPYTQDTFRTVQNRPGVEYDPGKTTSVFAEDQIQRGNAVRAIEYAMGTNPGVLDYSAVNARNSEHFKLLEDWFVNWTANTGTVSSTGEPLIYTTPDAYHIKGSFSGLFSSGSAFIAYMNTIIQDFVPGSYPLIYTDDATGTRTIGTLTANAQNNRLEFWLRTGINGDIWYGEVDVTIPRQIELWQQPSNQFFQNIPNIL